MNWAFKAKIALALVEELVTCLEKRAKKVPLSPHEVEAYDDLVDAKKHLGYAEQELKVGYDTYKEGTR